MKKSKFSRSRAVSQRKGAGKGCRMLGIAKFLTLGASVASLSLLASNAQAAAYSWDPGLTPATPSGGDGTWDTTTANWSNGTSDLAWTDTAGTSDVAAFGGTAGTVTLNSNLGALGLIFTTPAYTLSGTGTLRLGTSGIDASALSGGTTTISTPIALVGNQSWNVGSGATVASSGIISGSSSIAATGAGTVTLSGANTFTGGLTVNSGTVLLGNAAGAGTGTITLNGGTLGASGSQTITNTVSAPASTTTTLQGTGVLTLAGYLTGSGTLNVGPSGVSFQTTTRNASNVPYLNGFTGTLNVGGTLGFNSPNSANGASYYYNLSNAAMTFSSGGNTVWYAANGGSGGTAFINLGSISSASGIGTLGGPSGGTANTKTVSYTVGTLNTNTTFGGVIANSANQLGTTFTKVGTGTLILDGTNTYTGATTIRGGTLQVGDGTSGSLASTTPLTFKDTGVFNYAGQSAGSAQSLGALTATAGAGRVQSTYGGSGVTSLTFSNVVARSAGATLNFVTSGGTNGSTNEIAFTQVAGATPTTGTLLDTGYFFGGSSYAAYDAAGFVRAYGSGDTNYLTATGTNAIASTSTSNVALTGNVDTQSSASINTLNMGANTLALADGAAFQTNGILVSGSSSSTISGGSSLSTTTSGAEMVIRVDGSTDALNISTPILANGTNALTKTGSGALTLSGVNSYSGTTYVDQGVVTIAGSNNGSGGYVVNNSGTLNVTGTLTSTAGLAMLVGNGSGNGVLNVNSGSTVTLGTTSSGATASLEISNSSSGADTASGTVNVNGGTLTTLGDMTVGLGGNQTGKLVINSGTVNVATTVTKWLKLGQYDNGSGEIDINGGNLNLHTNTAIKFNVNGGAGASVITQNAGTVTFYSDNGTTIGGTGDLDMQYASSLASNTYNLNGGTLIVPQVDSTATGGTRTFNFNGGTLTAAKTNSTFFNLGTGNARANVRNGGAIIDTNGNSVTIVQALLHSNIGGDNAIDGGLAKNGVGTLTLNGVSTYTGATTINAGTLALGSGGSLTSTTFNIAAGATLDVSAQSSFSLSGKAVNLSLNNTAGSGLINAGTLALTLGGTMTFDLTGANLVGTYSIYTSGAPTGSFSSIAVSGSFSGSFTQSGNIWTYNTTGESLSFDQSTGVLSAVPEPSTVIMTVMGLFGMVAILRRRRMTQA